MGDKAAVIAEILAATAIPVRQPGDVDKADLAPGLHVNVTTVTARMQPLVDAGVFESLTVYDPAKRRKLRVWRKCEQSN